MHKVVVQFHIRDLPNLTDVQRNKFIHLLGPRYNPEKEVAKMSCESFGSIAENKRYLSDTIDSLLKEAKDGKDTFADVPFDFRHHKPKPKLKFPDSWLMTPERKQQVEDGWSKMQQIEDARRGQGKLPSGQEIIKEALLVAPREAEPVLVKGKARR
jgi:small subunit ribosomal protein S35